MWCRYLLVTIGTYLRLGQLGGYGDGRTEARRAAGLPGGDDTHDHTQLGDTPFSTFLRGCDNLGQPVTSWGNDCV